MDIYEENLRTPVTGAYDVLVAGGGVAGVAAALSAARAGAKTLLIEREYMLGGLATAGLIAIYLPLCDGNGRQVSFSIAEELLRVAIKRRPIHPPEVWLTPHSLEERVLSRRRFDAAYDPYLFAMDMEPLLLEAGVTLRYGTCAVAAHTRGGEIDIVAVESKSGREAVRVGAAVDATGDADLCHLAGAETRTYSRGNLLAGWYYSASPYTLRGVGWAEKPEDWKTGEEAPPLEERRFSGLDAGEITDMMILSHKHTLAHFEALREKDPDATVASISSIPQLRMTRRLHGLVTPDHDAPYTEYPDCVGIVGDWRRSGAYQIPLGMLRGRDIGNLFAAGRCVSAQDGLWDAVRVIPACAVTGEAAGLAAALYRGGLDAAQVREALLARGALLSF